MKLNSKQSSKLSQSSEKRTIVFIGAGVGGAVSALEFAKSLKSDDKGNYELILVDARKKVGEWDQQQEGKKIAKGKTCSTSFMNPGRTGHGFHYIHPATSKQLMQSTIKVLKRYRRFLIGSEYPLDHPINRGRYFISKASDLADEREVKKFNSLFPPDRILSGYTELQEYYRTLVAEDPENQVLGNPDDFIRILKPEEYKDRVDAKKVAVGVETTERLIDTSKLAQAIFKEVQEQKNITIMTGKKVIQLEYGDDKPFMVIVQDVVTGAREILKADLVINSAWENMELIDQTLGLYDPSIECMNRLKVLAVVKLPEELKEQNSMFFCMGPFCMFSNHGKGVGLLTFAPVTNVDDFRGPNISEKGRRLLRGDATEIEINQYGQAIIEGVAQWIPVMKRAELIEVRFGVVKTIGDINIFDPKSKVHEREGVCVESIQLGIIRNPAMKLMNMFDNAEEITKLIPEHICAAKAALEFSKELVKEEKSEREKTLRIFFFLYLCRHFLPQDFLSSSTFNPKLIAVFSNQIHQKSVLCAELLVFKNREQIFEFNKLSRAVKEAPVKKRGFPIRDDSFIKHSQRKHGSSKRESKSSFSSPDSSPLPVALLSSRKSILASKSKLHSIPEIPNIKRSASLGLFTDEQSSKSRNQFFKVNEHFSTIIPQYG